MRRADEQTSPQEPHGGVQGEGGFGGEAKVESAAVDVKTLHAKIGELTLENDFLEGALTKAGLLSVKR
jgi:outer membrane murein-binding lipoprotein Lpp